MSLWTILHRMLACALWMLAIAICLWMAVQVRAERMESWVLGPVALIELVAFVAWWELKP